MTMYCPAVFAIDDLAALHALIRARVLATLALADNGQILFAYAPVVLAAGSDKGTVRFHLARANPVARLADGASLAVSFVGSDAYLSPDWYETEGLVPTWNYIAVEGRGIARKLPAEELATLLEDLSAQEEEKLRPKAPWTLDKVPAARQQALLNAIDGFELRFETLHGKFKLSQDKKPADIAGVLEGLSARGDAASLAVVTAMRVQLHQNG